MKERHLKKADQRALAAFEWMIDDRYDEQAREELRAALTPAARKLALEVAAIAADTLARAPNRKKSGGYAQTGRTLWSCDGEQICLCGYIALERGLARPAEALMFAGPRDFINRVEDAIKAHLRTSCSQPGDDLIMFEGRFNSSARGTK
jgi:hypothetical protein